MTAPAYPVTAQPDSRLAQLQESYAAAKAAADEADATLKAIVDAIKVELAQAAPEGSTRVDLAATPTAPALRLSYAESWRLDAKRLKAEAPTTYVRYAVKSGSWRLSAIKGGGSE